MKEILQVMIKPTAHASRCRAVACNKNINKGELMVRIHLRGASSSVFDRRGFFHLRCFLDILYSELHEVGIDKVVEIINDSKLGSG